MLQASKFASSSSKLFASRTTTGVVRPLPRSAASTAKMSATKYDLVVKGDDVNNKLADCPFCQRILITLNNKGIEYDKTFVDFSRKPDWLMECSGGKVPVLRQSEKGMVMPDSDVIAEYLEKEHPSPSMTSIAPAELGGKLFPTFIAFVKSPQGSPEDAEARAPFEAELQAINDYLQGKGPFLGGASLDAKDAAVGPKLYHACLACKAIKDYSIPDKYKAIQSYIDILKKTPAFKDSLPTDGDVAIVDAWKAKVASGWNH